VYRSLQMIFYRLYYSGREYPKQYHFMLASATYLSGFLISGGTAKLAELQFSVTWILFVNSSS